MGLAFLSKFQITLGGSPYSLWLFSYYLTFFIAFVVFGVVFQLVFFSLLIWLYGKAANYAVDFSERLETRFGDEKDTSRDSEMSPFSIYKGGTLLQGQLLENLHSLMYEHKRDFVEVFLIQAEAQRFLFFHFLFYSEFPAHRG